MKHWSRMIEVCNISITLPSCSHLYLIFLSVVIISFCYVALYVVSYNFASLNSNSEKMNEDQSYSVLYTISAIWELKISPRSLDIPIIWLTITPILQIWGSLKFCVVSQVTFLYIFGWENLALTLVTGNPNSQVQFKNGCSAGPLMGFSNGAWAYISQSQSGSEHLCYGPRAHDFCPYLSDYLVSFHKLLFFLLLSFFFFVTICGKVSWYQSMYYIVTQNIWLNFCFQ